MNELEPTAEPKQTLDRSILSKLLAIRPAQGGYGRVWPVSLELQDGRALNRVAFRELVIDDPGDVQGFLTGARSDGIPLCVEGECQFLLWRVDEFTITVPSNEIRCIAKSPHALPSHLVDKLYAGGETGMGYYVHTIVFEDNSTIVCMCPCEVLMFPDLPSSKRIDMVRDVIPHSKESAPKKYGCYAAEHYYTWFVTWH